MSGLTRLFCAWIFTAVGLAAVTTKPTLEAELDGLLRKQFVADRPGVAALVTQGGQVVYRKAMGRANLELDVPMSPEAVFRIGSLTKQFTAAAILQLAEAGKLSLDDSITRFLSDYPTQGHVITIEHLLSHTSGIKDLTEMPSFTPEMVRRDLTPRQLVDFFKNEPMEFAPGERYHYNNSGYILLGYIVEIVTGAPYEDYIENHFFKPLGMSHSYFDRGGTLIKNRVAGYKPKAGGYENADFLSMTIPYASGAILTTIDDLGTWIGAVTQLKVINQQNLERAQRGYSLKDGRATAYGFGWELGNVQGSPTIRHVGRINGCLTYFVYLTEARIFVTLFSNCNDAKNLEMTASEMAALVLEKPFNRERTLLKPNACDEYCGTYVSSEQDNIVVAVEDDRLVSMASGGEKTELLPLGNDRIAFSNSLSTLRLLRDSNGIITGAIMEGLDAPRTLKRISESRKPLRATEVDRATLDTYLGRFELAPNFILTVIREGHTLYGVAGGRKVELVPFAPRSFFARDIDLRIVFNVGPGEKIVSLTKFQNGELVARRID